MIIYIVSTIFFSQLLAAKAPTPNIPTAPYQLIDSAAHSSSTFTQGLVKEGDILYESSGLYQRSYISRHHKNSTTTVHLPQQYFAEGLTLFKEQLFLITWKEETLFIIDKNTLKTIKTLSYKGEGWGLTHNHEELIMSNGSSSLFFRDPETFSITKVVNIKGLNFINELEFVNGIIWANSLNDDHIYAINPNVGCIIIAIDLSSLRQQTVPIKPETVLNGIAYDRQNNGLWVTGKFWPKRYLIALPNTDVNHDQCPSSST